MTTDNTAAGDIASISGLSGKRAMRSASIAGRKSVWVGCVIVACVALALRLIHLVAIKENPFFYHPIVDAWSYHKDALRMIQSGDWIGKRVFFQAPLTSYFLALAYKLGGVNLLLPRIVQILLGTFSAVSVFLLGRRLFNQKAGWIAGLATAVYPLFIFFEGELLAPAITITLDVTVFLLIFYYAKERPGWRWLVPGLIFGVRALATTNNLATVPVFWIWLILLGRELSWSRRATLRSIGVFTLGIVLAIAPVTARNWIVQHEFVLVSSNAGINFYLGNSGDYEHKVRLRPGPDWDEFVNQHVLKGRKVGPEMSGYFFKESFKYMREHPGDDLKLLLYKTYLLLHGDEILRNQEIYAFRAYSPVLRVLLWKLPGKVGLACPFGILLPLAVPAAFLMLRKRKDAPTLNAYLLKGYAGLYALSVIAFFVTARYRLPIVIPMILLAAYGWTNFRVWWQSRLRWVVLAGMVGAYLLANTNLAPMPKEMNPDAYYSLANTCYEQGEIDLAEKYYRKAIELNPADAGSWLNLGLEIYETQGEFERAMDCYRKAIELRPDYAKAYYDLARLLALGGRSEEAKKLYEHAIRIDPLMAPAYVNLAYMALKDRNYERARRLYEDAYRIDPQDVTALIGLGIATFQTGRPDEAIDYLLKAREIDPSDPDIYFNLATIYSRTSRNGLAAEAARKAIELNPEDSQAYLIYAESMKLAGRTREARRFLEGMARRYPDLGSPERALKLLRELGRSDKEADPR